MPLEFARRSRALLVDRWARARVALVAVLAAHIVAPLISCSSTETREEAPDEDDETIVRSIARAEIERQSAQALSAFLDADASPRVRARVALALARQERLDTERALLSLLDDEDASVRASAAFGLGQLDLALDDETPSHASARARVEGALVARLDRDADEGAKRAIVRALGRVARGAGRGALLTHARARAPLRATAFLAVGTSGARAPWPSSTLGFASIIEDGLRDDDVLVRRAAAYATFRQQELDRDRLATLALVEERDPEAVVHLLRALTKTVTAATKHLSHADWRVQVEAVRALARGAAAIPIDELAALLEERAGALAENARAPGVAHVVMATCDALVNAPRERTVALLDDVIARLAPVHPVAACACAVARDAQEVRTDAIARCGESDPTTLRVLEVRMISRAHLSLDERARALAPLLADEHARVRLEVAHVLAARPSPASSTVARARLATERDAAVAGALLSILEADTATAPDVDLLRGVVDRFLAVETFEEAEPLLVALRLADRVAPLDADPLRASLAHHALPHVRLAAVARPAGERAPGALARTDFAEAIDGPGPLPRRARVGTDRGEFVVDLDGATAPVAVANFAALAKKGALSSTGFHRVVADFVIQGGDPRGDGSGGPGYTIPCENSDLPYATGTLGMALAGKDTGGSQFFVTHGPQPHLDGRYTVFGRVVTGQEVVDAIVEGDRIRAVSVE